MIEEYFGPAGALSRILPGYEPRTPQVEMARLIEGCIRKGGELQGDRCAILPVEGDTGIGKSLASLIPMLHQVALHKKSGERVRAGYATFTTQLRRQIAGKDLKNALRAVQDVTGVDLKVAEYCGAAQYLSTGALDAAWKEVAGQKETAGNKMVGERLRAVLDWLQGENDGLMISVKESLGIEEHAPLVPGRSDGDWFCTWREAKKLESYQKMRKAVEEADIVLVSHAAALVDVKRWFSLLSSGEEEGGSGVIRYMIFDEAHRLPDAARNLTEQNLSLQRVVSIVSAGVQERVGKMDQALLDRWKAFQSSLQGLGEKLDGEEDKMLLSHQATPDGPLLRKFLVDAGLADLYSDLKASVKGVRRKSLGEDARMAFLDVLEVLDTMEDFLKVFDGTDKNPFQLISGVSWSGVRGYPSFRLSSASPGRLVARYWRHYSGTDLVEETRNSQLWGAVILSATLPPLQEIGVFNRDEERKEVLGWQKSPHLMVEDVRRCPSFAPDAGFGEMDFVLSSLNAPDTMEDKPQENGRYTNPEWETDHLFPMIAGMMREADEEDGVMILVPSFPEVNLILEYAGGKPWEHRVIAQRQGDTLAGIANKFLSTKGGVLLTAGGWEGLDLPGRIRHLMITRIPRAPMDLVHLEILREKYGEQKAAGILMANGSHQMRAKFKQGLGRAIRKNTDRATVWIADSRLGLPKAIGVLRDPRTGSTKAMTDLRLGLSVAFSERFLSNLDRARVFSRKDGVFQPRAPEDLGKRKTLGEGFLGKYRKEPVEARV